VLLDSPGLFAPNRAAIFDAQLLAVLNLLSSVVMYNSINIMDRSAIEKLSYAVETGATGPGACAGSGALCQYMTLRTAAISLCFDIAVQ
jgi:hypothetical protein